MKNILLIFSLLAVASYASAAWELNDVSYLMGLPGQQDGKDFLITPGSIFPMEHEPVVSDLVTDTYDHPEDDYAVLRVIGMRIDPCFKFSNLIIEKCTPQMRLIWQPLADIGTDNVRTYDAAVHTFYRLSPDEFNTLKNKLVALKNKNKIFGVSTDGLPIGIHPAYLNKKRRASFNKELKEIILSTVNSNNFVRFTFMKQLTKEIWWRFGGMDKDIYGNWKKIEIPRLVKTSTEPNTVQDFFNDAFDNPMGLKGDFVPHTEFTSDSVVEISSGRGMYEYAESKKKMAQAIKAINRIENPNIHSPATMDCVSCHIADPSRTYAEKNYPELVKAAKNEGAYIQDFLSGFNLHNPTNTKNSTKSLRAFGYFGADPSINQRALNESAAVASELNRP